MAEKHMDTSFLDRAIRFAVDAHSGVERRGKGFPYVIHPLETLAIAATMTSDQEILAAAVLHDTVEDTSVTLSQLAETFSPRVAALVESESDKLDPTQSEASTWHQRKQQAISRIAGASHDSQIIALADKLSNMRAIARDYAVRGDEFWTMFHVTDRASHEWHYRGLVDSLRSMVGTDAFREFEALVDEVFGKQVKNNV